MYSIV